MIRVTSATHIATCLNCRDKFALNISEPCQRHAAESRGLRLSWLPVPVAAWSAATPTVAAKPPVDLWKPYR